MRICTPAEVRAVRGRRRDRGGDASRTPRPGETFEVECEALITLLGFHSHLGSIADWGLELHGKRQILVDPSTMETTLPGVYAAGDVAGYEGKITLISIGFGEAAIAANQAIAQHPRREGPAEVLDRLERPGRTPSDARPALLPMLWTRRGPPGPPGRSLSPSSTTLSAFVSAASAKTS